MIVLFETTYLASGWAQSADDIALDGEQVVDEAEFFRAATATFFPRGNIRTTFEFTVHYIFATQVLAEQFVLTLPTQVPMTNADNGALQCICGELNPATQVTCYLSPAVLRRARIVRQVGISVDVRYTVVGGTFTTQAPATGLPTYPNPNEVNPVYRRGQVAIGNGATSVAITFSAALPGLPGAVLASVMAPTGSDVIDCTIDSDTVSTAGMTVALAAATPNGNYILNYAVFM